MALSPRQQILYQHRCDIYAPSAPVDPDTGEPQGGAFTLVATGVPCYFDFTPNVDQPTVAGRIRSDNLYTFDHLHFALGVEVLTDYLVVNRTIDAQGEPNSNYGKVWRVRGDVQAFSHQGRRRAGKQTVMAIELPKAPEGMGE